jgi:hypothetical protein
MLHNRSTTTCCLREASISSVPINNNMLNRICLHVRDARVVVYTCASLLLTCSQYGCRGEVCDIVQRRAPLSGVSQGGREENIRIASRTSRGCSHGAVSFYVIPFVPTDGDVFLTMRVVLDPSFWLISELEVSAYVENGFTFPVADLLYRVADVDRSPGHSAICLSKSPVDNISSLPTPGCLALLPRSKCMIGNVTFEVQSGSQDVAGAIESHPDACHVIVSASDSSISIATEQSYVAPLSVMLKSGCDISLTPALRLKLVRVVPADEARKVSGWFEFQLIDAN